MKRLNPILAAVCLPGKTFSAATIVPTPVQTVNDHDALLLFLNETRLLPGAWEKRTASRRRKPKVVLLRRRRRPPPPSFLIVAQALAISFPSSFNLISIHFRVRRPLFSDFRPPVDSRRRPRVGHGSAQSSYALRPSSPTLLIMWCHCCC